MVAVVGSVGAGKSSLISAILGDMLRTNGVVHINGSGTIFISILFYFIFFSFLFSDLFIILVSYVSQQSWIMNETLQNNILFGRKLEEHFYQTVTNTCALGPDIQMLPAGDQTEIGERGINLSGGIKKNDFLFFSFFLKHCFFFSKKKGQKQRVSIARAVYNESDIYLFDDPLSAVDEHVGRHIFDNVIGKNGILKEKARLFVTHRIQYLPKVDQIIVLKNGRITEIGTYNELINNGKEFSQLMVEYSKDDSSKNEEDKGEAQNPKVVFFFLSFFLFFFHFFSLFF